MPLSVRPHRGEAAPYYFKYIDLISDDDVVSVLGGQLAEARRIFQSVSGEQSLYRYAPEKWSMRQVLNHITDTERTMAFRAYWFARGFDTSLPSYDQHIAANGADADNVAWAAHIEEFEYVRKSTIALFQNFPPAAWRCSGIASDNAFTVRALAYTIAGHYAHHITGLHERYLPTAKASSSDGVC